MSKPTNAGPSKQLDPIEILDVIHHRNQDFTQQMLVISRPPMFVYDRESGFLIAEDSGFFSFYYYDRPTPACKAFGGRKFEIPMVDGTTIDAHGQWWFGQPKDYYGLLASVGSASKEELDRVHVFCSSLVDTVLVEDWLAENEPSNNYHKYDKRHKDFGKHTIVSRWE